ncbi:hypothetical protein TURU_127065 [Turdus rufiventris]|nr:hypothetical protein TURU_127065 [Turdus rufiventris]
MEQTRTSTVLIKTTGNKKKLFTVLLGVLSDGQKLGPMVIFKRKMLPKDKFGINVAVNPKGSMDEQAKLRFLWETWIVEGKHSYTKTGRLCRASYATVCQWILDAWGKVTTTTIIRGFTKADIIPGLTSNAIESTEIDNSDGEDTSNVGLVLLNAPIAQLQISDTEDEEFEGFMEDEAADEAADE